MQGQQHALVGGEAIEGPHEAPGVGGHRGDEAWATLVSSSPFGISRTRRRCRPRTAIRAVLTTIRCSQASKRPASRSFGSCRQTATKLLGDVRGVGLIAGDRERESVHGIHPASNDPGEGIRIALPSSFDQALFGGFDGLLPSPPT